MVGALEQEQENYKSRLLHIRGTYENTRRHTKNLSVDTASILYSADNDMVPSRSQGSKPPKENPCPTPNRKNKDPKSQITIAEAPSKDNKEKLSTDIEQMKERFAKLLLGEDMSGGGKGVSSALALSNAITNLAASVFGEQRRLEPMPAETKSRWRKEIDWLLSVTNFIVEFVPSRQKAKNGTNMEIMVTRQRNDLHMNIPALRKLDAMLTDCLDNFKDQNEFYYVSRDSDDSDSGSAKRKDEKWWLPTAKVPPNGLSDTSKKFLQYQKDCVNQVLKAAMAINAQVLSEMEIPEDYLESLPKNGRESLGDSIYKSIRDETFDPDQFLLTMDLSSEHTILDLKNRIEASIVIWRRKMNQKDGKSTWGSTVSLEKRELFEERAETILLLLKHRFPGLPQSDLDISKIQYNQDVGQALLESYSRILESLAFTVMSRIEDVLYADYATQNPSEAAAEMSSLRNPSIKMEGEMFPGLRAETPDSSEGSVTLLDIMNWGTNQGDPELKESSECSDNLSKDGEGKHMHKLHNILITNKKVSNQENSGGLRSPT